MLSGLQQKLKYTHKDGFCCLVATSAADPDRIVGVVEVSLQGEKVNDQGNYVKCTPTCHHFPHTCISAVAFVAVQNFAHQCME